jgi:hypothetical protein
MYQNPIVPILGQILPENPIFQLYRFSILSINNNNNNSNNNNNYINNNNNNDNNNNNYIK